MAQSLEIFEGLQPGDDIYIPKINYIMKPVKFKEIEDEEMDVERCPYCGSIVSECECHVWFEEY